jgi:hypothetical protein
MQSLAGSILAIAACGVAGAVVAWLIVSALGWTGTAGALLAAIVAMAIAFALFVSVVALFRRPGGPK